jgi:hypothetical protein
VLVPDSGRADPHARDGRGQGLKRPLRGRWWFLATVLAATPSCGASEPPPLAPVARETAEDEILRIARAWRSTTEEKGFRTAPSRITLFDSQIASTIVFDPKTHTAKESLSFAESFQVTDGSTFKCHAETTVENKVRFGNHADEAAVEIRRPALRLGRICDRDGFPEPVLELPESAARFALRADQLVPILPPSETRTYLPAS